MRRSLLVTTFFLVVHFGYAQTDSVKKFNHYASIQTNQLIRQILNFGGSGQNIDNPYLLNYAWNSASGWGVNVGFGLEVSDFEDGDELDKRETFLVDGSLRLGLDKKTQLNKRWIVGWGIDVLRKDEYNYTQTVNRFDDRETEVETENRAKGWGFGPRGNLIFVINDYLLIGTEASYYYLKLTSENSFETTSKQGGIVTNNNEEESDRTTGNFSLNLPMVLFLTLRF